MRSVKRACSSAMQVKSVKSQILKIPNELMITLNFENFWQLSLAETVAPSSANSGGNAKRGRASKPAPAVVRNYEIGNVAAVEPSTRKRKSKVCNT